MCIKHVLLSVQFLSKLWNIKQGEAGGNPRPLLSTKKRHLQFYWIVNVFESLTVSTERKKVFSSCQITLFSLKPKTYMLKYMLNASVKDSESCTLTLNQWSSCLSSGQGLICGGGCWPVMTCYEEICSSFPWFCLMDLLASSAPWPQQSLRSLTLNQSIPRVICQYKQISLTK